MRRKRRPERDPFEVLGVPRDADDAAIKRAYRRLAAAYHPDRNPDSDATEKLKEVVAAWEILSDPEERQRFRSAPAVATPQPDPEDGAPADSKPAPSSRTRPSHRPAAASRTVRTPRPLKEFAPFEALFVELFLRDADSAADIVLGWLGASVCLMALLFYGFQAAVGPFFRPEKQVSQFASKQAFEGDQTVPVSLIADETTATTRADYADRRFWIWMAVGSCFAFLPAGTATSMFNTLALLTLWRRHKKRHWHLLADVPEELRTGIRGCGVIVILVIPNAWPWLIWS